nr:hypothetical protein [Streptomyces cupreus]
MLAAAVNSPDLPQGWAAEPKWDGFRAQISVEAGRVVLRSRRGTDLAGMFPEIVAATACSLGERLWREASRGFMQLSARSVDANRCNRCCGTASSGEARLQSARQVPFRVR